uniref:Protein ripply1-like n=1 Tax=Hippocampus comes TaxID=109280 RepID=A0A3Q2XVV8_HIPCM
MCDFTPPLSGAWKHLATRQKSNLAQPLLNSRVRRVTTHSCDLFEGAKDSTRLGSYRQRHFRSPLAIMNARGGFNVSDANQPSDMWRPWIRNDSTASLLVVNFDLTALYWPKTKCFDYLYREAEMLLRNYPVQATICPCEDSSSTEEDTEEDDDDDGGDDEDDDDSDDEEEEVTEMAKDLQ